jgi:hypothetical protein
MARARSVPLLEDQDEDDDDQDDREKTATDVHPSASLVDYLV